MTSKPLERTRARAACGLALSALLLAGCSRDFSQWAQDLDDRDPFVRRLAAAALGQASPLETSQAAATLLPRLEDPERSVRTTVARALAAIAVRDTPAFVRATSEARVPSPDARTALGYALENVERELLPRLLAGLEAGHDVDIAATARILEAFECDEVVPLAALVRERRVPASTRAAALLARLHCDLAPAVDALAAALSAGDAELRRNAALALAECDDPRARAALDGVRDDPDPIVRLALRQPYVRAAARGLLSSAPAERARALDELAALDEEGMRVLVGLLDDIDHATARAAASALKQVAEKRVDEPAAPSALDAFAGRESDPDASVRALALLAAFQAGAAPDALDATWTAGLEDPAPAVRVCAALSLSRLGARAREALPLLQACAASDASRLVREAAAMTVTLIEKPREH